MCFTFARRSQCQDYWVVCLALLFYLSWPLLVKSGFCTSSLIGHCSFQPFVTGSSCWTDPRSSNPQFRFYINLYNAFLFKILFYGVFINNWTVQVQLFIRWREIKLIRKLMQMLGMLTAFSYLYYTLRFNFLMDIYWLRGKIWIICLNTGRNSNA